MLVAMPDARAHRGPAPKDASLFGQDALVGLRAATAELSWLLTRGYAERSALKLVGDRHGLTSRQRTAVSRCACSDPHLDARRGRALPPGALRDRAVAIDGFNALIVCESALSGAVVLVGRDRAHRDLASVHGTWRRVEETPRALWAIGEVLEAAGAREVRWVIDRPVGNSGRLRALLASEAEARGWPWTIALESSPDRVLAATTDAVIATADAWILDRAPAWVDLPAAVIARAERPTWIVDLG